MIKANVSRGKKVKIKTRGTLDDVSVEMLFIISLTFKEMHKHNPEVADEFKRRIIGSLLDPKSPVFKIDRDGTKNHPAPPKPTTPSGTDCG